jgi:hypothetical protein
MDQDEIEKLLEIVFKAATENVYYPDLDLDRVRKMTLRTLEDRQNGFVAVSKNKFNEFDGVLVGMLVGVDSFSDGILALEICWWADRKRSAKRSALGSALGSSLNAAHP